MPVDHTSIRNAGEYLLRWYDSHARVLPWRRPPGSGGVADPYDVWLSEIMLQQTTVAAAAPYWQRFRELWPDVAALAAADEADVLREWAGLGYYARARNLLAAARAVMAAGGFPTDAAGWRALPGVGPYTAAAIAAIAFGERAVVIDANIERVASRLFALPVALPAGRRVLEEALAPLVPEARPGDFAQAMMDLGSSICTPRSPRCLLCPLAALCRARALGTPEAFPLKAPKRVRPLKRGTLWWVEHGSAVALVRRPSRGLLGGMPGLPGSAWAVEEEAVPPPFPAEWEEMPRRVRHGFTHFELELRLLAADAPSRLERIGGDAVLWTERGALAQAGLPTVFARAVAMALAHRHQTETA